MTKDEFWGLKVSTTMDRKVRAEAERRGMNLSEFVRYCISVFFDHYDDGSHHQDDGSEPNA